MEDNIASSSTNLVSEESNNHGTKRQREENNENNISEDNNLSTEQPDIENENDQSNDNEKINEEMDNKDTNSNSPYNYLYKELEGLKGRAKYLKLQEIRRTIRQLKKENNSSLSSNTKENNKNNESNTTHSRTFTTEPSLTVRISNLQRPFTPLKFQQFIEELPVSHPVPPSESSTTATANEDTVLSTLSPFIPLTTRISIPLSNIYIDTLRTYAYITFTDINEAQTIYTILSHFHNQIHWPPLNPLFLHIEYSNNTVQEVIEYENNKVKEEEETKQKKLAELTLRRTVTKSPEDSTSKPSETSKPAVPSFTIIRRNTSTNEDTSNTKSSSEVGNEIVIKKKKESHAPSSQDTTDNVYTYYTKTEPSLHVQLVTDNDKLQKNRTRLTETRKAFQDKYDEEYGAAKHNTHSRSYNNTSRSRSPPPPRKYSDDRYNSNNNKDNMVIRDTAAISHNRSPSATGWGGGERSQSQHGTTNNNANERTRDYDYRPSSYYDNNNYSRDNHHHDQRDYHYDYYRGGYHAPNYSSYYNGPSGNYSSSSSYPSRPYNDNRSRYPSSHSAGCWTCGNPGHKSSACPQRYGNNPGSKNPPPEDNHHAPVNSHNSSSSTNYSNNYPSNTDNTNISSNNDNNNYNNYSNYDDRPQLTQYNDYNNSSSGNIPPQAAYPYAQ